MTDIVERLENCQLYEPLQCLVEDAAAEIRQNRIDLEEYRRDVERLCKYRALVRFIANDYYELSHDKIKWQRDDWKKRCEKLIVELYEMEYE